MEDIEILLKTLQDEHLVFRRAYKDVMVGTRTPNHLALSLFQFLKKKLKIVCLLGMKITRKSQLS